MKKICGIYKITNKITSEAYIGQSVDIYDRWTKHKAPSHQKYHLQYALDKYGVDNFTFEIIEECLPQDLDERERYWIAFYDTYKHGYNETLGGQGEQKYNYEEIYNLWRSGLKCKEIQQMLNCGDEVVTKALYIYGLTSEEIKSRTQQKRPIVAIDIQSGQSLRVFSSCRDAQMFLKGNLIGIGGLTRAIKNHTRYLGYYWEDLNDNNIPMQILTDDVFFSFRSDKQFEYTPENRLQKSLSNRIVERPDRQTLKKLIRTIPFTTIGKMYGNVSDNAIRKWCDFENLPRKKNIINSYSDEEWEKL